MKQMYGLAIVLLANIYQLHEMKKSWNMTQKNVAVAYQMAQEQCQLDQWRFCESPRYYNTPELSFLMKEANLLMTFLWVSQEAESIPHFVGSTTTWIWIHDNRLQENHNQDEQAQDHPLPTQASPSDVVSKIQDPQLRSETMRHRRLTEELSPCTHKSSSPFPDICLYLAWMEQGVRPECSRALTHLQNAREMQNLHKWMCQTVLVFVCAMWFAYAVWMLYRIMKRLVPTRDACSCCSCCDKCCSSNGCCSGNKCCCSGDGCCNSGGCCSGKCCCSAGGCCGGNGCCHENKCFFQDCCCCSDGCCSGTCCCCCSERKHASNRDAQGTDICVCCCCKTSSNNPTLEESCCNCCKGTGLCSAACASCCGGGCSSTSNLPIANSDEMPIRILVV